MVLGEGQIMYQVKAAHQAALSTGSAGPMIDALFKFALGCGKRVRSETAMGRRAVSISSAAVELARDLLGNLRDKTILVIGAGKMGQICLKLLLNDNLAGNVCVANRSTERVQRFLSNNIRNLDRLRVVPDFKDRYSFAAQADLLIVSSSARTFVLDAKELAAARANLEQRTLYVIDIAVPRNVDPEVAQLSGVRLYNSDDLSAIVNRNLAEREALVTEADKIVFEVLKEFQHWQRSLLVVPTIAHLREKIEAIRLAQMEKSCTTTQEIEEISRAIVNQILHHPTKQLKAARDYEILRQQAEVLRVLFDLDPLAVSDNSPSAGKRRSALVKH
jgi:glutamyl-tRNA reductase